MEKQGGMTITQMIHASFDARERGDMEAVGILHEMIQQKGREMNIAQQQQMERPLETLGGVYIRLSLLAKVQAIQEDKALRRAVDEAATMVEQVRTELERIAKD